MEPIVKIVVFEGGQRFVLSARIDTLPKGLKEIYGPFAGKTVLWNGENPIVTEIEQ